MKRKEYWQTLECVVWDSVHKSEASDSGPVIDFIEISTIAL